MRWLWVGLISAIGLMAAVAFTVVLNEPWMDSPNICEATP